ncbi:endonuclease 8-like 1 isoform X3 [Electrophorus electricus]|uniref:endonuclease 8-like 1 isoform X3 n=1 Tax=Electrophorus electricus TaxID=8005 RepID=UPI0015D080F8|nr:endonuclease 8-like 1 isoform X3 [Electrophorus electricus]
MPEGPELHLASLFVNRVCADVVFTGAVEKSEISKGPVVPFASDAYCISAVSRGKEVKLTLTSVTKSKAKADKCQLSMDVVFRFGMSGFFRFTTVEELPKHAHLRFYTNEDPQRALTFVDARRFGSWQPSGSWQRDRGPCVMSQYESFRENVLSRLADKAFDRPICEALLNQKYFNGIGNYLRAEILHRLSIPPFMKARTVLEELELKDEDKTMITEENTENSEGGTRKSKSDLLSLCHTVPLEVVSLGGKGYDPEKRDYTEFEAWLQCYYVDGMNSGDPGPMVPKGFKSPKTKRKIQKDEYDYKCSKKGAKMKQTERILKKETLEKEPRAEKEKGYAAMQHSTQKQNTNKTGFESKIAHKIKHAERAAQRRGGLQKSRTKITRVACGLEGKH